MLAPFLGDRLRIAAASKARKDRLVLAGARASVPRARSLTASLPPQAPRGTSPPAPCAWSSRACTRTCPRRRPPPPRSPRRRCGRAAPPAATGAPRPGPAPSAARCARAAGSAPRRCAAAGARSSGAGRRRARPTTRPRTPRRARRSPGTRAGPNKAEQPSPPPCTRRRLASSAASSARVVASSSASSSKPAWLRRGQPSRTVFGSSPPNPNPWIANGRPCLYSGATSTCSEPAHVGVRETRLSASLASERAATNRGRGSARPPRSQPPRTDRALS